MNPLMNRRIFSVVSGLLLGFASITAFAQSTEAPDAMIRRLSGELLEVIKTDKAIQAGETAKVLALVDSKVMPHVNFQRMTASAVGRAWRTASADQQKRLQEEFKTLLVRTYSGALSEVKDQSINVKPLRAGAEDNEVTVNTEVRGKGEPVNVRYRMEKAGTGWKIYDLNVADIWLVETYRTQFSQEINANGVDGLIAKLVERNKGKKS